MILYSRNAIRSSRKKEKWRIANQRDSLFPSAKCAVRFSGKLRPSHYALSIPSVAISARTPTALRSHAPISQICLSSEIELAHFRPAGVVHERTVPPRWTSRRRLHWAHNIVALVHFRFLLRQPLPLRRVFIVVGDKRISGLRWR
jgi:hypothetical protein